MQRHLFFWSGVLLAFGLLLWLLSDALLPFVAGLVIAYLLQPLVARLTVWGLPRGVAVAAVTSVVVIVLVTAVLIGAPLLVREIADLVGRVPGYLERLRELYAHSAAAEALGARFEVQELTSSLGGALGSVSSWLTSAGKSLLSGGMAFFGAISTVVLAPIIAFYLLLDWNRMVETVDGWIPPANRETVRMLFRRIDRALAGFIRGQSLVCLFLGSWYAIGLMLIGVNFGLLIGISAGVLSFIPFVGTFIGLFFGLIVATAQFWPEWWPVVAVAAVFGTGQFLEGNILSPKIVGEAVGLHPVWLIFALFAFGSLFGFVGLLVAVPVAAALGVLIRFALERYRQSAFFIGPVDASSGRGSDAA